MANDNRQGMPWHLEKHFTGIDCTSENVPIFCKSCDSKASVCVEINEGYDPGECLLLTCYNRKCKSSKWAYCKTCRQRVDGKWALNGHATTQKHVRAKRAQVNCLISDAIIPSPPSSPSSLKRSHSKIDSQVDDEATILDLEEPSKETEDNVIHDPSPAALATYPKRHAILANNDWLVEHARNQHKATISDIKSVFEDNANMRYFYVAEQQSPEGRCGSGLRYLVARAFQKTELIESWQLPTFEEAKFHIESFIQYQAMNDKQRKRHGRLFDYLKTANPRFTEGLLTTTHIPTGSQIEGFYGRQGPHSMWNGLPIPKFQNIGGIAYCSPVEIARYLMANGVPVDNIRRCTKDPRRVVLHVADSKAAQAFLKKFSDEKTIPLWTVDWHDGFGANRTKQNKNSIIAWTLTVAPTVEKVNSTDNTCLMALGMKKNASWGEVERLVHRDLDLASDPSRPIVAYSLATRTTVSISLGHLAAMEDRVERADATATLSHASDQHRCFGKLFKLEIAKCKTKDIETFQSEEKMGAIDDSIKWGWCEPFVDKSTGANGGVLPPCRNCRMKRLHALGHPAEFERAISACQHCVDWTINESTKSALLYSAPEDYPSFSNTGCPIPPPTGREVPIDKLQLMVITNDNLRNAVRYAFYQSSRTVNKKNKIKPWTKQACMAYLRTCGIATKYQAEVYDAAKLARGNTGDLDYDDDECIGALFFPSAWSSKLPLNLHIEMLMHQLNLGVAQDNADLCDRWFKVTKMGIATFKASMQTVLVLVKKFNLSWLMAEQFTGAAGSFGTGSWVAENWLGWIRLSKYCYAWGSRNAEKSFRNGSTDMSRMVISYVAVMSRLLTHHGIDDAFIAETEHYIKEFMSCVRELDIRVRHKQINTKPSEARSMSRQADVSAQTPRWHASKTVTKKDKKFGLWWMKANYISLFNLAPTMVWLGPLVNWWDGGGKGERFIQEIKPHIPRGVRAASDTFFLRLMERVYKTKTLAFLEYLYINQHDFEADNDDQSSCGNSDDESVVTVEDEASEATYSAVNDNLDSMEDQETDEVPFLQNETVSIAGFHQTKSRTVYIYKNREQLLHAVESTNPVAGVVVENTDTEGNSQETLYAVFRKPGTTFGWVKLKFDDNNGCPYHGLWYASISIEPPASETPQTLEGIQLLASFSAVAMPLKFVLKDDDARSSKYCVITNWWNERNRHGKYVMPTLDFSLY